MVADNGRLSLAEVDKAVQELYPQFDNKPALIRAFKAADRTGDGFITRKEFRLLLQGLRYFNAAWARFASLDGDGDRKLVARFAIVLPPPAPSLAASAAAVSAADAAGAATAQMVFGRYLLSFRFVCACQGGFRCRSSRAVALCWECDYLARRPSSCFEKWTQTAVVMCSSTSSARGA